jgi:hypothetical protein
VTYRFSGERSGRPSAVRGTGFLVV